MKRQDVVSYEQADIFQKLAGSFLVSMVTKWFERSPLWSRIVQKGWNRAYLMGLQKFCSQLGVDTFQVLKLYWEVHNVGHVVTLCCVILFSRYFAAILFAFIFM